MTVLNPHILIVGLGNAPMPGTRHSVGHLVVDALANRIGVRLVSNRETRCLQGDGTIFVNDRPIDVTLVKPKALMNVSGPPVAAALRAAALKPSSMIVIHDSLEHKPGSLAPKAGGSANGHNGVRSVIAALAGQTAFRRLRIGIGRGEGNVADYVLGRLTGFERGYWGGDEGVDIVMTEIGKFCMDMKLARA